MIGSLLTWVTRPTKPIASSNGSAMMHGPSSPLIPTAWPPSRLTAATRSGLTFPVSTIFTISMVFSSVTRRPFLKVALMPRRSLIAVISGPPPWIRTGCMLT